jgi:hypothetical protein
VPYPSCPVCGMTMFHRYPFSLASPRVRSVRRTYRSLGHPRALASAVRRSRRNLGAANAAEVSPLQFVS